MKRFIAALLAEYIDPTSSETTPATEDKKTMLADPEALRRGCESWHKW